MAKSRSIRLSQAAGPYGVGAIYDISGESFVLADTTWWSRPPFSAWGREVSGERLLEHLRSSGLLVKVLKEPMQGKAFGGGTGERGLPYYRFPRWLFCPSAKCRRMTRWTSGLEKQAAGRSPRCPHCNSKAVLAPMRFITVCENGHLGDVDWQWWAHSQAANDVQKTCRVQELKFINLPHRGGGLGAVAVKCTSCKAERSLEGITQGDALKWIGVKCGGRQPWQLPDSAADCTATPLVVQRGAGNVYYPVIVSSITIPPESDAPPPPGKDELIRSDPEFDSYVNMPIVAAQEYYATRIAERVGCTLEEVHAARTSPATSAAPPSTGDLLLDEWEALSGAHARTDERDRFLARAVAIPEGWAPADVALTTRLGRLVAVDKLREVRAFTGFYRVSPPDGDERHSTRRVTPSLGASDSAVPAVEVYGEGIFFSLDETRLTQWESHPAVAERAERLAARRAGSVLKGILPSASARYILVHTLAHLLLRRLAFNCGYGVASLQERIYCAEPTYDRPGRAGVLLYTSAGDVEGTLGGLVRQSEPDRFMRLLRDAVTDAVHCSSDPVCGESRGQGMEALNLAGCHACLLLPETSCTAFNSLLDRHLVVGDKETPGFLDDAYNAILQENLALVQ